MDTVVLNVGGKHFETTIQTLTSNSKYFESYFSRWNEDSSTKIFIDRDPGIFTHVLRLMRDPSYAYPQKYLSELDFFQITYATGTEIVENDDMMMERKIYTSVIQATTGLSPIELKILLDRLRSDINDAINSPELNLYGPIKLYYDKHTYEGEIRDILSKIYYSDVIRVIISESIKSYIPDFMFNYSHGVYSNEWFSIVINNPHTLINNVQNNDQQEIAKKIIEYINNKE